MTLSKRITSILLICIALSPLSAQESSERGPMERSYSAWRQATITQSFDAWTAATAQHRHITTKNIILSSGQPFPAALFEVPLRPPETVQLRFLKEWTNAEVGQLAYFGRIDMGFETDEVPQNLLLLRFTKELGIWKFDTMQFVNMAGIPSARAALAGGSTAFLDDPDFALPASAPAVPQEVGKPDHIAQLKVTAIGYRVRSSVNGRFVGETLNDTSMDLIMGGLKNGENSLTVDIVADPSTKPIDRELEIIAYVMLDDPERPAARVYRWIPDEEAPVPTQLEEVIWANSLTIHKPGR